MTPFARDGHLTDLGLELHLTGELDGQQIEAHLADCHACQIRIEAARSIDADVPAMPAFLAAAPPVLPRADVAPPATPTAANRPMWTGLLALAAALLLAALVVPRLTADPSSDDESWRLKGRDLTLQVFRDAGATSDRLRDGADVAPDDRIGFRVKNRRDGHLMIIGVTRTPTAGAPYVCYPQGAGDRSAPIAAADEPVAIPQAVRMDSADGEEHLYAVRCASPFGLSDVGAALAEERDLPEGCSASRVRLEKRP